MDDNLKIKIKDISIIDTGTAVVVILRKSKENEDEIHQKALNEAWGYFGQE